MSNFKFAMIGLAALCGTALQSGTASAMPIDRLANATSATGADVQAVRWVCGPYRCWWRPNYYPYYGYGYGYGWGGPRFYGRPWWGGRFYARPWWGGPRWY